ncbi:BppU family phage baseplate upper protein [Bacillus subtilis]
MYKQSEYTFNVSTTSQGTYNSAFKFSTQDVGTAKLIFNLRKDNAPLPLSAVTGKLVLVPANGKKRIRDITLVDKVNGIAEYVLDNDEIKMYGTFKAELVLVYSNGQAMSAHRFGFEVTQSLMDQDIVPVAEYYIDDFESLKEKIEELYNESVQTIEELRAKFEDLEKIETKEGAQIKANEALSAAKSYTDTHISDTANPHKVTKGQVGLDKVLNVEQASKINFDNHASDKTIHVTVDDRNKWNTAEANAKAYTDVHAADTVKHITAAERTKWNGSQLSKITADHGGVSIAANEGEDILQKIVDQGRTMGTFYAHGKAINAPSTFSTRGIFHLTGLSSDGKGMYGWIYATDYKNNVFTNYYDGSTTYWQGWKRSLSNDDLLYSYANITLKNGATAGTRTPIYAKWGACLLLRGHVRTDPEIIFGSIPSSMVPPGGAVVTVPLSGTGGTANLIVYENGDLKIKYPDPTDSSKLGGGYYIDVVIGYQEGVTV